MNAMKKLFALLLAAGMLAISSHAAAQVEAPDALIRRISQDVLDSARADKGIQRGDRQRIRVLVEEKILPHVDFQKMTALAAGRHWRTATPEQKQRLSAEFRDLLIHTYSGALTEIRDQKLQMRPLRASPSATSVIIYTRVIQPGREPIELSYRLEKHDDGWKIYDVNILGAWLVETYKGTFNTEISKGGIDGLIRSLAEKNRGLAAGNGRQSR